MGERPSIRAFSDEATNTVSYLVGDPVTREAAVIDPVLDYDPCSGEVDTASAEEILGVAQLDGWTIRWCSKRMPTPTTFRPLPSSRRKRER